MYGLLDFFVVRFRISIHFFSLRMQSAELQKYDALLLALEQTLSTRLSGEIIEETQDALRRVSANVCDTAMLTEALEVATTLGHNDVKTYQAVVQARQRIRDGVFGICLESQMGEGEAHRIPANRLQVMPYAENCVTCQKIVEARQPKQPRRLPTSLND